MSVRDGTTVRVKESTGHQGAPAKPGGLGFSGQCGSHLTTSAREGPTVGGHPSTQGRGRLPTPAPLSGFLRQRLPQSSGGMCPSQAEVITGVEPTLLNSLQDYSTCPGGPSSGAAHSTSPVAVAHLTSLRNQADILLPQPSSHCIDEKNAGSLHSRAAKFVTGKRKKCQEYLEQKSRPRARRVETEAGHMGNTGELPQGH